MSSSSFGKICRLIWPQYKASKSWRQARHSNMQRSVGPNFTAAFDLDHDAVWQTSIYPRYSWEIDKKLLPVAKPFVPPSPSQTLRALAQEKAALLASSQAASQNAPDSPTHSFLSVPGHPRANTISARSTSAGSETGTTPQSIETPQDFFIQVCLMGFSGRT